MASFKFYKEQVTGRFLDDLVSLDSDKDGEHLAETTDIQAQVQR